MVNTKSFLSALFIAFLVLMVSFFNYLNKTNTNITNLIEKGLSDSYNQSIKIDILDTYKSCDDFILVVYTYGEDDKIGYTTITRDQFSRYHIKIQKRQEQLLEEGPGIYVAYIDLWNEQQKSKQYFGVLSKNTALSKIEFQIKGNDPILIDINSSPSFTMIDLPYEWCSTKYWFLDKSDILIPGS